MGLLLLFVHCFNERKIALAPPRVDINKEEITRKNKKKHLLMLCFGKKVVIKIVEGEPGGRVESVECRV